MAERYTRRINLYINGKEVRNDIASISGEMRKLQNQQRRMTIGSKEYKETTQKIRTLKGVLQQHNAQLRNTEKSWFSMGKAADKFNRYFGMITATLASFTGVALTIKSATQAYAQFDDKLADVMKTTGLSKDAVKELNEELEKIDTRTSQEDLLNLARVAGKLGITAKEDILGFVRAADQISVALGEDLGGAEDAVRELGKLTDIFKIKDLYGQEQALLKIGSAINELGMASTANEGYLVEFSKRTAGIAPQAGISIQNILGIAATLDALGQKTEASATAFGKLVRSMATDTEQFANVAGMSMEEFSELMEKDANEAMIRVLEGVGKSNSGFQKMIATLGDLGVDGQRVTDVFGSLANNTGMLREQQALSNKAFEEGISLTEEFNIKNNTAQATLDKARKRFAQIQRELGERLAPAYASVIKKGSTMLKVLGATVEFLFKHGRQLAALIITIAAYTAATKLATLWQNRNNTATLANIVSQKLQALAFKAQFAAIALYNSAVALLTGRLKVATIQFRAFAAAIHANPIGIVVGAIVAAGAALYIYSKRLTAAEKAQKTLNDVNLEAKKRIVEEKMEVERLLKVAQDDFRLKEDRIKAIERLKEIAPEYLGNLKLETINTDSATTAVEKYIKALEQKARVQAATDKLEEIEKELLELQMGEGAAPNFWQQAWNAAKTGGNVAAKAAADANTYTNNLVKRSEELNLQKEKLLGITQQQINLDEKAKKSAAEGGTDGDPGSLSTTGDADAATKALEIANKQRILQLQQQYGQEESMQKLLHARLLANELAYLQAKAELETDEAKKLNLQIQIVEAQNKYNQAVKEAVEPLYLKKEAIDQVNAGLLEEEKLTKRVKETSEQATQAQEELNKKLTSQAQNYQDTIMVISDALYEMMEGSEDAFKKFAKTMLIFALEQLKIQAQIAAAGATVQSLAQPDSIATFGASGLARAAVIVGLIEAAFAVVEGLVNNAFFDGGHTGPGGKYEPVGIVHAGEYVVPKEGTGNPQLKPLIDAIEINRRAGKLGQMNFDAIMQAIPKRGFASGGYTSPERSVPPPSQGGENPASAGWGGYAALVDEVKESNRATVEAIKQLQISVAVETIERERGKYVKIQQTKGL